MVDSDVWTFEQAQNYDNLDDPMFAPELLAATTEILDAATAHISVWRKP